MKATLARWFPWASVLFSGTLFGGVLYEQLIIQPMWSGAAPKSLEFMTNKQYPVIHGLGAFYLLTPAMLLATIGAAIMTWRTKRGRPSLVAGIGATSVVAFTFAHFIPGCWCSSVPAARVTPVDTRQAGSLRWLSNGCCGIGRGWRFDKKVRYLCGLFGHRVREVTRRDGLVEYNVARVAPSGCQAGRPARSGALSRRQCLWASTAVGLRGDRTRNR